jgi:ubiquinone/menaquinone biosynthesis C-methylase UbiE
VTLGPAEVRAFYDRFGRRLDSQSFYEDAALEDLVAHARFEEAEHVFEFGCGTGRFAERLLARSLSSSATYLGCDVSTTMVGLATERLAAFGERARVLRTDGAIRFPVPDASVDRVIATYVLDLLSEADVVEFLREAYRVLAPGTGHLCLVSLTEGVTALSRIVSAVWATAYRRVPRLVGGCRPIRLEGRLDPQSWEPRHRRVVVAFGVPSEVLIARTRRSAGAR